MAVRGRGRRRLRAPLEYWHAPGAWHSGRLIRLASVPSLPGVTWSVSGRPGFELAETVGEAADAAEGWCAAHDTEAEQPRV